MIWEIRRRVVIFKNKNCLSGVWNSAVPGVRGAILNFFALELLAD
jgi:hypothetical protein